MRAHFRLGAVVKYFAMFVTHVVRLAKTRGQCFVVVGQLGDHIHGLDILRIVTDRSQRKPAGPKPKRALFRLAI